MKDELKWKKIIDILNTKTPKKKSSRKLPLIRKKPRVRSLRMKNTIFNGTEYYLNNHTKQVGFKQSRSFSLETPNRKKINHKHRSQSKSRLEWIYGKKMEDLCNIKKRRFNKRRKKNVIGFQSLRDAVKKSLSNDKNLKMGLKKRMREMGKSSFANRKSRIIVNKIRERRIALEENVKPFHIRLV